MEVGPLSWGCTDAVQYIATDKAVKLGLEFIAAHNRCVADGRSKRVGVPLSVVERNVVVDWIRDDDGGFCSLVAPNVQNADFAPLAKGDPLFLDLKGDVLKRFDPAEFGGADRPFFVNEAAYYEKGIAFYLGKEKSQAGIELWEEMLKPGSAKL